MSEEERIDSGETEQPEETVELDGKEGKKVPAKKYRAVLEQLEKAQADLAHWKNEYYKAYADTQNLRRSLEAEQRTMYRYRAEGFLETLLPALDAFHMALDAPAPTKEAANYQIGFTYIYNQIIQSLANEGLTELTPKVGDPFDASYMNAIEAVESDEVEHNHVLKVHSKGYKLHDRLIRAAMVTVAKKPKPAEETPQEETPAEEKEKAPAEA